jgi:hypothetical protein
MKQEHRVSGVTLILIAVCILGSVAASFSLQEIIPRLNKWQMGGYAIVGGIFIAMVAVIANEMLKFFQNE